MKKFYAIILIASLLTPLAAEAGEYSLPQLKITYDELALNYETYIAGTMELSDEDGNVTELPAQFKTRGATARTWTMKPSLNMKLRDADDNELDTDLLGLRKASSWILDAMAIDRINMRNRVAFDIWNDFSSLPYETEFNGRNGTVGKFVEIYINGEYKGIYCLSDKINRKLLDLKKPQIDEDGTPLIRGLLYKHGTTDIENQDNVGFFNGYTVFVASERDAWELHEPEELAGPYAWSPMMELYSDENFFNYEYVKEHFWLENLADYTVHLMALAIEDNWGNKNKYFSIQDFTKPGYKSRFVVTPWDLDTSLGGSFEGSRYDGNYTDWPIESIVSRAPLPFAICLKQPEFLALLKKRWLHGRAGALSVESVKRRLLDNCELFEKSGAWQRTVDHWSAQRYPEQYVDDLGKEINLIIGWYEARFAEMDAYFNVTQADIDAVGTICDEPDAPHAIYTIQGIRVSAMDSPGLYIVDGKKVIKR
ncbi:MAG: CotH kinase family protein [Muribaculaceae bacterium]|nr:CotH kinase family protein [Muribaculaceae bacterium]